MKRYDITKFNDSTGTWEEVTQDPEGVWIQYSDHEAEVKKLKEQTDDCEECLEDVVNADSLKSEIIKELKEQIKELQEQKNKRG